MNDSYFRRALCLALALSLALPLAALAQQAPAAGAGEDASAGPLRVAVVDLEADAATPEQAASVSERLRALLAKEPNVTVMDAKRTNAVAEEEKLKEQGCTSEKCAAMLGQILGADQVVTGRVTRLDDTHWLLSAKIIDADTGATVRTASEPFQGDLSQLLDQGTARLADRLSHAPAVAQPEVPLAAPAAVPPPAPAPERKQSDHAWVWWVVGGLVVVGVIAASGKKSSSSASPSPSPSPGSTTVTVTW
jgi:TolB-like protein